MQAWTSFRLHETLFMKHFQDYFTGYDSMFLSITKVSDPAYALSILFPVAASINTPLGADILVVTVVAEWINTLLKWVLMEDRPYWWVKEYGVVGSPELRQTPLTCETGPGSPSGHVMGFAAVLYALLRWACANFINNNSQLSDQQKKVRRQILWAFVMVALVASSLSRMFVAAHFPHQCVLGGILGLFTGYLLTDNGRWCVTGWWKSASRFRMFLVALTFIIVSAGFYGMQIALGIDPQWSVRLAFKWCQKPENVHVVTTPLFCLVRDCGSALGLALASPVILRKDTKFYPVLGVSMVIMTVVCLTLLRDLIPTANAVMFYACQYFLFATTPFVLLFFVPVIASLYKVKED